MSFDTLTDNALARVYHHGPASTTRDEYNNPIEDEDPFIEVNCWFEYIGFGPLGSFESPERREVRIGRDTILIDARVLLKLEYFDGYDMVPLDIDGTDRVDVKIMDEWVRFEVLGPPSTMALPRGQGHTVANLRRVEG